ncbi:MAG: hypothetical protein LLG45_05630 [Actinomycetia bacterium]|nr:hypothetical protein [Actinomycetes bacterium]
MRTLQSNRRHGCAFIDRARRPVGDQVYADPGSVHQVLRTLEATGRVNSRWEAGPSSACP